MIFFSTGKTLQHKPKFAEPVQPSRIESDLTGCETYAGIQQLFKRQSSGHNTSAADEPDANEQQQQQQQHQQ